MFRLNLFFVIVIGIVSAVRLVNGYRILGICPTPTNSHQVVFRALTLALNKQGHELVVVTANPVNDSSLKNYTEIDISFGYDIIAGVNFIENQGRVNWLTKVQQISDQFFLPLSDRILDHPELRKLYASASNEKFDLVLVEMIYYDCFLALGKRFDVPVIGVSSLGLTTNVQYAIGEIILPSHKGNWEITIPSTTQSFWQRLDNFIVVWKWLYWYQSTYMSAQNAIAKKYFGNDIPDLNDLQKNISLIFVNQQAPIAYARTSVPKVIQIGGIRTLKQSTFLPKELAEIFDEATQGFVYMSLGGTGKSSMLPQKVIDQFIAGFSKLPYKVLWKFEEDVLPGKPDNVFTMKWVPQQAVLAHPNLKVFVYQGGLQSTEEAVENGVPLVGLPAFADQDMQVNKMVSLGVAIKMDINALDGDELSEAITTVANDLNYKQRMLNLRSLITDKPSDPLENAIQWTEHVIRHKGAPHLHSATADEPWYSRQDMDIVAFISVTLTIILCLTFLFVNRLFKIIYAYTTQSCDAKTKIN